jgi:hypothetical protein
LQSGFEFTRLDEHIVSYSFNAHEQDVWTHRDYQGSESV